MLLNNAPKQRKREMKCIQEENVDLLSLISRKRNQREVENGSDEAQPGVLAAETSEPVLKQPCIEPQGAALPSIAASQINVPVVPVLQQPPPPKYNFISTRGFFGSRARPETGALSTTTAPEELTSSTVYNRSFNCYQADESPLDGLLFDDPVASYDGYDQFGDYSTHFAVDDFFSSGGPS